MHNLGVTGGIGKIGMMTSTGQMKPIGKTTPIGTTSLTVMKTSTQQPKSAPGTTTSPAL